LLYAVYSLRKKLKKTHWHEDWRFFGLQESWIKAFKPQKKLNQSFKKEEIWVKVEEKDKINKKPP